mmetsp:Transcript_416/g.1152  ORF Transcript_416/g.1152 Transcript_416/m.1152 type:complete len:310 (+) Transcript_416:256-1185(+)
MSGIPALHSASGGGPWGAACCYRPPRLCLSPMCWVSLHAVCSSTCPSDGEAGGVPLRRHGAQVRRRWQADRDHHRRVRGGPAGQGPVLQHAAAAHPREGEAGAGEGAGAPAAVQEAHGGQPADLPEARQRAAGGGLHRRGLGAWHGQGLRGPLGPEAEGARAARGPQRRRRAPGQGRAPRGRPERLGRRERLGGQVPPPAPEPEPGPEVAGLVALQGPLGRRHGRGAPGEGEGGRRVRPRQGLCKAAADGGRGALEARARDARVNAGRRESQQHVPQGGLREGHPGERECPAEEAGGGGRTPKETPRHL